MRGVKLSILIGQLDRGNQEMILFITGVSAQYQPVDTVVLPLRSGHVRQPLGCQAGPLQRMGHHQVVQEWCVLLPDLVLLVDNPLFNCLVKCFPIFISHLSINLYTLQNIEMAFRHLTYFVLC